MPSVPHPNVSSFTEVVYTPSIAFLIILQNLVHFLAFRSRHDPSCTMWSRIIPFWISFSYCKYASILHIDRYQHSFPHYEQRLHLFLISFHLYQYNYELYENASLPVIPVFYKNNLRHLFSASSGKRLTNFYIMKIIFQISSLKIAQIFWHAFRTLRYLPL